MGAKKRRVQTQRCYHPVGYIYMTSKYLVGTVQLHAYRRGFGGDLNARPSPGIDRNSCRVLPVKVSRLSQNVLAYCCFVSVHGGGESKKKNVTTAVKSLQGERCNTCSPPQPPHCSKYQQCSLQVWMKWNGSSPLFLMHAAAIVQNPLCQIVKAQLIKFRVVCRNGMWQQI